MISPQSRANALLILFRAHKDKTQEERERILTEYEQQLETVAQEVSRREWEASSCFC